MSFREWSTLVFLRLFYKDKRHSITSPSGKLPELPNFIWNFGAYIQKSLMNQIHLEIFCLAGAFPWAISQKLWRNCYFLLGPFMWIMYVFILFHICLSSLLPIARPLIPVHIHRDIMAIFILWLSKGNGHFQGLWKETTRYPLV